MTDKRVLVVGAGGPLGLAMVSALRQRGHAVIATYRTPRDGVAAGLASLGAEPVQLDLTNEDAFAEISSRVNAAILSPILTVSSAVAPSFADGRPVVFFSSNNVAVDPGAPIYAKLKQAEEAVLAAAPGARILRPTMIYGHAQDGNLARLMRFMRRSPVTFLPGRGDALQQPLYFEDLAAIAVAQLFAETGGSLISVAGPDAVAARLLYRHVAEAGGAKTLIASVPTGPLMAVIGLLEAVRLPSPISGAQLARIDRDKGPRDEDPKILGETPLSEGLRRLARDLDDKRAGA